MTATPHEGHPAGSALPGGSGGGGARRMPRPGLRTFIGSEPRLAITLATITLAGAAWWLYSGSTVPVRLAVFLDVIGLGYLGLMRLWGMRRKEHAYALATATAGTVALSGAAFGADVLPTFLALLFGGLLALSKRARFTRGQLAIVGLVAMLALVAGAGTPGGMGLREQGTSQAAALGSAGFNGVFGVFGELWAKVTEGLPF